jgi:putative aminopeptidase FrvX
MLSDSSLGFLTALLETPGPSGFETGPARRWGHEAEAFADVVTADVAGNSYATLHGKAGDAAPLMLAGHIDEIGLMVLHIDEQGFLWFQPIGGWDRQVLVGQRVILLGRDGPVPGVIGVALADLEKAAALLASFARRLTPDTDLVAR